MTMTMRRMPDHLECAGCSDAVSAASIMDHATLVRAASTAAGGPRPTAVQVSIIYPSFKCYLAGAQHWQCEVHVTLATQIQLMVLMVKTKGGSDAEDVLL